MELKTESNLIHKYKWTGSTVTEVDCLNHALNIARKFATEEMCGCGRECDYYD